MRRYYCTNWSSFRRFLIIAFCVGISSVTGIAEAAIVNLAWDPAQDASAASYLVRYGTQSGQHPAMISCGLSTQCTVNLPDNQIYYFVVIAVGPSGLQSEPSNEVMARVGSGSLLLGVNQTSVAFPAEGGITTVGVTGPVQWAAETTSSWLRIAPGAAATGNGTFEYAVTPNASPSPRSGIITVGGMAVLVSQPAGPPSMWNLPTSLLASDYDGDGKADVTVYRDTTGQWFTGKSSGGMSSASWGSPSLDDIPVPADYDGDNRSDRAVYRRTTGQWFVNGSTGFFGSMSWGARQHGDLPVPSDYDGDGRADVGVFRTTTGYWYAALSGGGTISRQWGAPALKDVPVPADYDGDGRSDLAVYRQTTGEWFMLPSGGGSSYSAWGAPAYGDVPVPADYDGDGRTDIGVYRSSTGQWLISKSSGGSHIVSWGSPTLGDIPMPGDYDGDGRTDPAVYRSSSGTWIVAKSTGGMQTVSWGSPSLSDIVRSR